MLLTQTLSLTVRLLVVALVFIVTGITGILQAVPRPTNTSGDFIGLRNTAGFIELPRGQNHFPAGFAANLYRW